MADELERLREAWLDFVYAVLNAVGYIWLIRRLGFTLKPWAAQRAEK